MHRFLKVIRFDGSDDHVFERAAAPDEWAVSGAFAFAHLADAEFTGKLRQAFANGFLGLPSLGRTTFATVAAIDDEQWQAVEDILTRHIHEAYGAPDEAAARAAAADEMAFIAELAGGQPVNTVLTVRRVLDGDGRIREEFRDIRPPSEPEHARIWDIANDD